MSSLFKNYQPGDFFDEMFSAPDKVRPHYRMLLERMEQMSPDDFNRKRHIAERA